MKDGRTLERLATIGEYTIYLRGWLSAVPANFKGADKAQEALTKIEKEIRALHKETEKRNETNTHESSVADFLKTDNPKEED